MRTNLLDWLNKEHSPDLSVLQWALPTFLCVTATIFELIEHGSEYNFMDAGFIGEMIIFGFMGPIIIALILNWMRQLMDEQKKAAQELQVLNRALEQKVEERTTTLELRNIELGRANQELQRLDQMKSEFVSLVSHELRAPLATLNGGLELTMQNPETLPAPARHTLETMISESARLTRLVQTILDISRLEAGKLTINPGPVALRPLMEEAAEVILVPQNRPLDWKFSTDLPPVWADEIHLEEIMRNLMQNAAKYSQPGSPIHLSTTVEDSHVRISIRDHGVGVPLALQDYIFERFGRANNTENSVPGWGLGLYFARKLIQAQNGSIGIISPVWTDASAPGSEFFLLLPVAGTQDE